MATPLRVLIVEDSEEDTQLLVRELRRGDYDPIFLRVDTSEATHAALTEQHWDIVIADYSLPHFTATGALALLQKDGIDIPFIIVSGVIDEDTAVASLKAGAHDFILKSKLARLIPAIERELREAGVRRARKRAEEALSASEGQLRAVLDTVGEGIVTIDSTGTIVMVNREATRIWGYRKEEIVGKSLQILMPDKYRIRHATGLKRYRETRTAHVLGKRMELEGLRKDGATFPLELLITETQTHGRLLFTAAVRDITERRQSEQALAQLAEIVKSSDDAILSISSEGIVMSWNAGAERIYGYKPDEIIGRPISVTVPPERAEELKGLLEKLKQGQRLENFETLRLRKDGKPFFASLTLSPMKDPDGEVRLIAAIVRDTTRRKMSEAKLQILTGELQQSNQQLEQFAYVASHDLKEPLRTITSFTQLLSKRYREKLDRDANDFIGYIVSAAARMQALIDDLLAYSRLGRENRPLALVDLEVVLRQVVGNLSATIRECGAIVTCDPLPTLLVDGTQMTQLFQNLIENALKFHGKEPSRIHISAKERGTFRASGPEAQIATDGDLEADAPQPGDEWVFSIRDNGIGIDPQHGKRIFLIFQRLHTQDEYPGTGVGLAICKKIVERHGGRIWVASKPGNGTTFYFTIPIGGGSRHEQELLAGQPRVD